MTDNVYWMDDDDLDPFQRKKKRRIRAIKKMLKDLKKISLKEFIAKVTINCGIHERTVREYLEALETVGDISIKNGMITFNETSTEHLH